ncbi:MAG: 1-acyl-sn-glycerol-3-phosphate acyltransferase [Gammaproteobacteria bacterium]|nr:1-acyl-sn-glycerol-3-phosphate acyltransferase [Gammaproteobacteria bacterium]
MFNTINWLWRLFATAICYITFGLGALTMGLLIFSLIRIFTRDPLKTKQRIQYTIHKGFSFFIWLMQALGIMTVEYQGVEKLKQDKGVVVIANHPSLIDVVIIIGLIPYADCIVKEALWNNFFIKWIVKAAYIPNRRAEGLIDDCRNALSDGGNLVIFPEGTRTEAGKPLKFQRGVANIAINTKADIRPIQVHCKPEFLTKRLKWYQIPPKKAHFLIKVDDRIATVSHLEGVKPTMASRKITKMLEDYYRERVSYD